jgi:hypothetical protein
VTWQSKGLCFEKDTNIFFDIYEENESIRQGVDKKCGECPVNRRCFAEGISGQEYGVWGGVYIEEGEISKEFNTHKSKEDWQTVWQSLTMEV